MTNPTPEDLTLGEVFAILTARLDDIQTRLARIDAATTQASLTKAVVAGIRKTS